MAFKYFSDTFIFLLTYVKYLIIINYVAGSISTLAKAKAYVEIFAVMKALSSVDIPVSYTHLTLPTNREV